MAIITTIQVYSFEFIIPVYRFVFLFERYADIIEQILISGMVKTRYVVNNNILY